ncbi:MAG: porin, partial [Nitrospiria bacterium]
MKKGMIAGILTLLFSLALRPAADAAPMFLEKDGIKVGYDGGFVIKVKDKFKLHFASYVQFQHVLAENDAADDTSTFRIAKGRLRWSGFMYNPKFTYLVQLEVADGAKDGTKDTTLKDAWLNIGHYENMSIRVGQYFVPFNRQQTTFFAQLQFVDTSFASKKFNANQTNPRDVGIMLSGRHDQIEYTVGVFNGNGINQAKDNDDNQLLTVGRVRFNPFGKMPVSESDIAHTETPLLTIGGAVAHDAGNKNLKNGSTAPGSAATYGLEFAFKHQGKSVQGEYYYRDARNNPNAKGAYIQGGLFLVPKKVEVAARYGHFDSQAAGMDEEELTAGANFFFAGHRRKLQIDVSRVSK